MTTAAWNLDFNAGARLDPRVAEAMASLPREAEANPHSPHRLGRAAHALLEDARERIAACLGVAATEVVFTSGGTEANNLAVLSCLREAERRGMRLAVSAFEHPSIANLVPVLGGVERLPVDADGRVGGPEASDIGCVAVIHAHHELGVVQDLSAVRGWLGSDRLLHTDASQSLGRLPIAAVAAVADYVTLSPHKAGGPRGIGVLVVKEGRPVTPLLRGGSQELGRRPGTQSPRLAQGAAAAVELAVAESGERAARMRADLDAVLDALPRGRVDVLCAGGPCEMLPNTRTIRVHDVEARHLLPALDLEGILVSYGSACSSGAREPSPSLAAIGLSARDAACCVRISLGGDLGQKKVEQAVTVLCQVLARFGAMAP